MRWIGTEMRDQPTYDGTSDLNIFLTDIDGKFTPEKRILVLDIALKDIVGAKVIRPGSFLIYQQKVLM
jgi:hypothetical protein